MADIPFGGTGVLRFGATFTNTIPFCQEARLNRERPETTPLGRKIGTRKLNPCPWRARGGVFPGSIAWWFCSRTPPYCIGNHSAHQAKGESTNRRNLIFYRPWSFQQTLLFLPKHRLRQEEPWPTFGSWPSTLSSRMMRLN